MKHKCAILVMLFLMSTSYLGIVYAKAPKASDTKGLSASAQVQKRIKYWEDYSKDKGYRHNGGSHSSLLSEDKARVKNISVKEGTKYIFFAVVDNDATNLSLSIQDESDEFLTADRASFSRGRETLSNQRAVLINFTAKETATYKLRVQIDSDTGKSRIGILIIY